MILAVSNKTNALLNENCATTWRLVPFFLFTFFPISKTYFLQFKISLDLTFPFSYIFHFPFAAKILWNICPRLIFPFLYSCSLLNPYQFWSLINSSKIAVVKLTSDLPIAKFLSQILTLVPEASDLGSQDSTISRFSCYPLAASTHSPSLVPPPSLRVGVA